MTIAMAEMFGHCIICHKDNVPLSDEHVIPKSIGGYYHVFNVCDDCNSKRFGAYVDPLLTDHPLIQLIRWQKKLKGHNGSFPHPLSKPDGSSDGSKYGVSDKTDVLEPFLYPQIKVERDNKGQLTQLELEMVNEFSTRFSLNPKQTYRYLDRFACKEPVP